jgi:hypothetical protein
MIFSRGNREKSLLGQSGLEYTLLLMVVAAVSLVGFNTYLRSVQKSASLYYNRISTGILGKPNPCGDGICSGGETAGTCCVDCAPSTCPMTNDHDCEWLAWGPCVLSSGTCGTGTRTRGKIPESGTGQPCVGPSTQSCAIPCPVCGNGRKETGEACDGIFFGGKTCADFGFASGKLTCRSNCTIDTSGCTKCGNGTCDAADGETPTTCADDCWSTACFPPPGGHARLCPGGADNVTIPINGTIVGNDVSSCSLGQKCQFYCDAGYHKTGTVCVADQCTGGTQISWSRCNPGEDLNGVFSITLQQSCLGAPPCAYHCKSGYIYSGGACVVAANCVNIPTNAQLCYTTGDQGLAADTNSQVVDDCSAYPEASAKCIYSCFPGYHKLGNGCSLYYCTPRGFDFTYATLCLGDEDGLTENVPYHVPSTNVCSSSTSQSQADKCEVVCNSGFTAINSGTGCGCPAGMTVKADGTGCDDCSIPCFSQYRDQILTAGQTITQSFNPSFMTPPTFTVYIWSEDLWGSINFLNAAGSSIKYVTCGAPNADNDSYINWCMASFQATTVSVKVQEYDATAGNSQHSGYYVVAANPNCSTSNCPADPQFVSTLKTAGQKNAEQSYSCLNADPTNGTLCVATNPPPDNGVADNIGLTSGNLPKAAVFSCTAAKCEYYCPNSTYYHIVSSDCVNNTCSTSSVPNATRTAPCPGYNVNVSPNNLANTLVEWGNCNPAAKCQYACIEGYRVSTATDCAQNTCAAACQGTYSAFCAGDNTGIIHNNERTDVYVANGGCTSRKCECQCAAGNVVSVDNVHCGRCTTGLPTSPATQWKKCSVNGDTDDERPIGGDTWNMVASCSTASYCEFICNPGYSGATCATVNACGAKPATAQGQACTPWSGTITSNGWVRTIDDDAAVVCPTNSQCIYRCSAGYRSNASPGIGTSCAANACVGSCPANSAWCAGDTSAPIPTQQRNRAGVSNGGCTARKCECQCNAARPTWNGTACQ